MLFSLIVINLNIILLNFDLSMIELGIIPLEISKNSEFSWIFVSILDYFLIFEDQVILVTTQVIWSLSLDNYNLYFNFLKNLFTIHEVDLLFKSFKELEVLDNFSNIEKDLINIYSPANYETNFISNYVNYFILDSSMKFSSPQKDKIFPTTEFFCQFWLFIETQLVLIETTELILWKKILNFFLNNSFFMIILSLSVLILNKSTNLIYTLLSFLSFAIISGLIIIFWGSEYIGFCVLLIYGAAIPVLALYIIMLVNVDLIQWLFFIESVKNFTFKMQLKYIFISIFISSFIFLFNNTTIYFDLSSKIFFINQLMKHFFFLLMIRRYLNFIDTSYGLITPSDISTNFYSTDIDKVASAAFKISYNELFALVLLLLVAIIVVISISRPTNIASKIISYELHIINKPLYKILLNQSIEIENIVFWFSLLLTHKAKQWKQLIVIEPFNFRFYWSLHLFFWGKSMGDQPYKNLMYLLIPRWWEKK